MRTRMLLTTVVLMSIAGFITANCRTASLKVNLPSGSDYELVLDGQRAAALGTSVIFSDLRPGMHRLSVIRPAPGCHHRHNHRFCNRRKERVVFTFDFRVRQVEMLVATVDEFGRVAFLGNRPAFCSYNQPDPCYSSGMIETDGPFNMVMDDVEFESLIFSLRNRPFENTRVDMVRNVLASNHFSVRQIRTIMEEFDFESSRLEVAKMAYDRTIDRERYFMLYDAFVFDSSVNELSRFIEYRS